MEKSGSRPFSPIYQNFQNLLDHNQGIFRLFRKTKNPGMYQAVWQARQAEVDTLKERLDQMEASVQLKKWERDQLDCDWREEELSWFEQYTHLLTCIDELKDIIKDKNEKIHSLQLNVKQLEEGTLQGLEKEIETWKEKAFSHREELEKYKTLSRSLNRVIEMKRNQESKQESDVKKLQGHLNISQQALIKLDDEYEKERKKNLILEERVQELEDEIKQSNAYAKEYRRINHRMENELYRMNNELEKVQSLLN
ncbi:MAG: hypothetical protein NXH75_03955 [Halobacteriovoraceae bacterium]|nr:hypothetical protein [Halobacteriovoraceae bacterium]